MRLSWRFAIWAAVAVVVALSGACVASRLGMLAPADLASLWSWSLDSWESTDVSPSGETLRIVHEPLALARNLAIASFGFVGLALSAPRLLELFGRASNETGGGAGMGRIHSARKQLDGELDTILTLVRAHLESNQTYSAALRKGHNEIVSPAASPDQVRAAIILLIAENQKMLRETEEYARSLDDSRRQIDELRATLAETQELNVRDSLTQVYTRRYFDTTLERVVREAGGSGGELSLIMADIDHFKKINDTHGHPIGDEVLKNFARTMTSHVETKDTVARYGGEEFAIILPATGAAQARLLAERIRSEFETKKWAIKGGRPIGRITASFGVARLQPGEGPAGLIQRADAKLYVSKSGGRNRVSTDES
ncbi:MULTISPECIES: GGDEF domain-containing protein [Methylosinus]|uniref:diguanylate cyclase n=1 Tax=Methylosinus trichosporium (strain ATCC 35070 / NCIMB 11131 / UNIQEM 75 / OB3b) TaxID=595536 RepID=A0A2D2CUR6_METT3|nr:MULTISPECIES: GGDEF domain-containing protein [Methylosinus]ATQ66473.1 GGDEF domain-containing protein [Methylosinus trichosporium OB3b]OBS51983.1 diguanylate cyclase [Methylosinus sp. 3S-1]